MFKGNWPLLVFVCLAVFAEVAVASTAGPGGGSGMQWETPIQTIVRSLSGPVAYGFAVLGVIALAIKYLIGGDLGDTFRQILNVVIVISMLMFAVPMLGTLFVGAAVPDGLECCVSGGGHG